MQYIYFYNRYKKKTIGINSANNAQCPSTTLKYNLKKDF